MPPIQSPAGPIGISGAGIKPAALELGHILLKTRTLGFGSFPINPFKIVT